MPVDCACQTCGKHFTERPARIRDGRGKFCSKQCYWQSKSLTTEAIWSLVDQSHGSGSCWEWQGTITSYGYGQVKASGQVWRAHRLIYQLTHGSIPDGLVVRHTCDNRKCCNPAHLELGTHDDNMRDRQVRGRTAKGPGTGAKNPQRGTEHHAAKLNNEMVHEIRRARAEGETYTSLATRLGVCVNTVRNVAIGLVWKHVA